MDSPVDDHLAGRTRSSAGRSRRAPGVRRRRDSSFADAPAGRRRPAARRRSGPAPGRDRRPGRRHRLRQDHADRLVNRLYDVTGGSIRLDGVDIRDLDLRRPAPAGRGGVRGADPVLRVGAGERPARPPGRHRRGGRRRRCGSPRPISSTTCRGAWTPGSASRACRCPAVNGSGWRWPGRSSADPRCWCSTTRCRRWTSTPRRRSRRALRSVLAVDHRAGGRPPGVDRACSPTGSRCWSDGRITAVGTHSELMAHPGLPGPAGQPRTTRPGHRRRAGRRATGSGGAAMTADAETVLIERPTPRGPDSARTTGAGSPPRTPTTSRRRPASSWRPGPVGCSARCSRPHRRSVLLAGAARRGRASSPFLVGPLIVAYGIDTAVPALIAGDGRSADLVRDRLPLRRAARTRWPRRRSSGCRPGSPRPCCSTCAAGCSATRRRCSLSFHEQLHLRPGHLPADQ